MTYLNLEEIKKHLNVDDCFQDDDSYIESLADVSEEIVEQHLRTSLDNIASEYNGKLPAPIRHAMLLLIGNYYANRESVTFAQAHDLPLSYEYLLSPYVSYESTKI